MIEYKWDHFLKSADQDTKTWASYFVELTNNAENKLNLIWEGHGLYGADAIVKSIQQDHPAPVCFTLSQLGQLHEHIWNFNPTAINPEDESKCAHAVSALAFLVNDKIETLLQLAVLEPKRFGLNTEDLIQIKTILEQQNPPNELLIELHKKLDNTSFVNLECALLNHEKLKCISMYYYEYNNYLNDPKTQNTFNKHVYITNTSKNSNTPTLPLIEAKKMAMNQLGQVLQNNCSDIEKLESIEKMMNKHQLDVLNKADSLGEVLFKYLQKMINSLLNKTDTKYWKDRMHHLNEVIHENKSDPTSTPKK